ncbi:MAG: glucuronate isomerase [Clostridia bacterium]
MQAFMDQDFLLSTKTARALYHEVAKGCPIIDYHCHISPRQIYEDLRYENLTQVWLNGDHYKWRLMRFAGVPEELITGNASDYDKFVKWAEVIGKAIGNPLYHWSHLELRRFFGYHGTLSAKTADEVWALCNEKLQSSDYSVRELIRMSNVETICSTDDPIDDLQWHQKLAADASFGTAVLPAWRPDKAMGLEKPDYLTYLSKLSSASGISITSLDTLKQALTARLAYFAQNNCCLSDHALPYVMYAPVSDSQANDIFQKRLAGQTPTASEQAAFKTMFMLFMAKQYKRLNWTMQLHYGCNRDNNSAMFDKLGPDTGYDCIDNHTPSTQMAAFLNALEATDELPQTVIYSLNPNDNEAIDTICGCFQNDDTVCKLQHGSAWWFNDHFSGMTQQLTSLANLGYLPGFVGMLTDSRSFLSYSRHEYFRRILCRLLGSWVEEGMFPDNREILDQIVRDVSYENAKRYFHFKSKAL